ncbi:MAG: DUF1207 domain-containing protein [Gammaproteobacteria bacterium]|nr:DUF1207 domain-containing protein [Gammaproteobacteria bacterium]
MKTYQLRYDACFLSNALIGLLLFGCFTPITVRADEAGSSDSAYIFFPERRLYAPYLADVHATATSIENAQVMPPVIAYTTGTRFDLKVGGVFGLIGKRERESAWQLSITGGFRGQFDIRNNYDNIGWDGLYGLQYSRRDSKGRVWRAAFSHTSGHVGDEYAEDTGRLRIGYSRHELLFGGWLPLQGGWKFYTEAGWAYRLGNTDLQVPGRLQAGLEYHDPRCWGKVNCLRWYLALDTSAMEELDWHLDSALQLGIKLPSEGRQWRLALIYYDGRSNITEFFQTREKILALGLWTDL